MMTHYEIFLATYMKGFDILLCVLVYSRHLQKRLPFFAVYATTILVTNLGTTFVYAYFGFQTAISFYAAWIAITATLLTRSFAIAELCSDILAAYRGIWALTWRVLGLLTVAFLVDAAIDAQGQPHWIQAYELTLERDIEIASVVILIAMLLVGAYYRLSLDPLQEWLVSGLCLFCVIQFVNTTVFRNFFNQYISSWTTGQTQLNLMNNVWNTVYIAASSLCIGMWCYALRKPLPEPVRAPVLLPAGLYQKLSPELNLQLRSFNDRLLELLKS
jgi:hypothetical protein